ncbi:thioredoxin domain-containing protein [Halorussus halophilus]|uniref:thioredoxin domain-containing protein n=1 Tax=Halorussus halophilus TaxID=2650975 RepID=UPI001300F12E|nr:thioredoxin domain-containing protein [Halorussus halophilus]
MAKPENDTSASEPNETAASDPTEDVASELFDELLAADVLVEGEAGVRTTDEFDDTHAVYHDSYVGVPDEEFHESVAATFGLPDSETAADAIVERGLTRTDLAVALSVRSHCDDLTANELAVAAGMVGEIVPKTPVPADLPDVSDDPDWFVTVNDRAVVTVWKRFCDPCERIKDDLDALLDGAPESVAVAGIDGEVAVEFCEEFTVDAAPGFVLFEDGEAIRTVTGSDREEIRSALRAVYS